MGVSKSFFSILIFGRKFITFVSLNFRKCWSFPSKMNQRGVFRVFFNIPRRNQYIAYWRLRSKLDIVLAGGARNIMYFQYYRDILVLITSLTFDRGGGARRPRFDRGGARVAITRRLRARSRSYGSSHTHSALLVWSRRNPPCSTRLNHVAAASWHSLHPPPKLPPPRR